MIIKIKKMFSGLFVAGIITVTSVGAAFAASESLNGGSATWSGGVNSSNILYSQVVDNKSDGLRHSVTVWVENDKGTRNERQGVTSGVGEAGKVYTQVGATDDSIFVPNKCGYKNYSVVK